MSHEVQQVILCDKNSYFILDNDSNTDSDKQADLVRYVKNGHKDEVVCIQYSAELSLIATGTVTGEIALWDYEFSKLLDYCIGHRGEIIDIHFLWPYPVMLTTSMDNTVFLWSARSVGQLQPDFRCLYRFEN